MTCIRLVCFSTWYSNSVTLTMHPKTVTAMYKHHNNNPLAVVIVKDKDCVKNFFTVKIDKCLTKLVFYIFDMGNTANKEKTKLPSQSKNVHVDTVDSIATNSSHANNPSHPSHSTDHYLENKGVLCSQTFRDNVCSTLVEFIQEHNLVNEVFMYMIHVVHKYDVVEAMDQHNNFCLARILDITELPNGCHAFVRYVGWPCRYDEWIHVSSHRFLRHSGSRLDDHLVPPYYYWNQQDWISDRNCEIMAEWILNKIKEIHRVKCASDFRCDIPYFCCDQWYTWIFSYLTDRLTHCVALGIFRHQRYIFIAFKK